MKSWRLIPLLCGITVLSAPLAEASTIQRSVKPPLQQVDATIGQMLLEAFADYRDDQAFSMTMKGRLQKQKEQLMPVVEAGIRFLPNRVLLASKETLSPYEEWEFWLEMAKLLGDHRLLTPLVNWLTDPRPMPSPFKWVETVDSLLPPGEEGKLIDLFDQADAERAGLIIEVLQKRKKLAYEQVNQWLIQYANQPKVQSIVTALAAEPDGVALLKKYFGTISDGAELDAAIVDRMDFQRERDWLQQVAKTTVSPLIEQKIDARLVFEKGDLEAAKRLHESGEKLGYSIPLNGTVEKFLIRLYPDGSLSQGIKRYEAITGKAYFYAGDDEDWYQSDGTDYNQPKRGIEQWTQFLQTYPNHPAADDAAYRLSRCYQLIGHYDQALHWYEQATVRGDRDMTFDASGQFVYVIDVEMGQADFAKLLKDQKLPEWKKVWFRYTKAVDLIRSTQYKQAADELARLIEDADGKNVFEQSIWNGNVMYGMDEYDAFWDRVKEQLNHTRKLADLQDSIHSLTGQTKAQKQYELAAAIYHNEMTYYNYLWRGERQSFFWLGQIKTMEYNEKLDHYIGSFNHLIQASHVFSGINLDEAGGDLAAKTLYSLALCYSKLTEYGMEVGFHLTDTQLVERIVQTGENLLKRVPQSDLADDMLMLMFNHTQQAEYLERLIKGYPTADQASKAKKLLEEMMNQSAEQANEWKQDTACVSRLPYQTIFPDDSRVTPAVKAWTDKHRGSYYQGSMKEEEWTYFFLSNTEGKKVELGGIEVNHKKNYVYFYAGLVTDNEKRFRKRPDVLVRVPTRFLATGETKFQLSN